MRHSNDNKENDIMSNYLCVFTADSNEDLDVIEVGNDPDFSKPMATWGICRPNIRYKLKKMI